MMRSFAVRVTPRFERLARKLRREHRDFDQQAREAARILAADPYNRSREHDIKKLHSVPEGEGGYRLRLARWRFRYDIWPDRQEVELHYCGPRREDTYS